MKLTLFILADCPFCKRALKYIDELKKEYPEFQSIELDIIEEDKQEAPDSSYEYYYVPTFFLGKEKLHEGGIYKEEVKAMFETLLKSQS